MTFSELLNSLTQDSLSSLGAFGPELAIVATILALLFARLFDADQKLHGSWIALVGTMAALALASRQYYQFGGTELTQSMPLFTGLLLFDPLTVFFRIFLLLFLLFVVYLTIVSGIPDREDAPDFYVLLLGSTLGMLLMASANHLLMVFLAVEMTSVPSYALVGFLKGRRQSSEASLKYVVYGAGAAGIMLYGISLLCGLVGTAHLPAMAERLAAFSQQYGGLAHPEFRTLALGILMILVGVAFKLSLFPFHFWCPDAFEGAAAEVGGFLSVASKAAAFALLLRLCLALVGAPGLAGGRLADLYLNVGVALAVVASVTATFGNLAAYAQTNMKRLLAYSTIAHAGYMLMAVAAMMVVLNAPAARDVAGKTPQAAAADCVQGLLYYLSVYFFMNLGAFAIVAVIRNASFSESIADYAGLSRHSPVVAVGLLICLFSLIGLPPFGGFVGKFMVFSSVVAAASVHWIMWAVLVVGLANTVFSLFYYLRVLRCMFLEEPGAAAQQVHIPLGSDAGRYVVLACLPVLVLGILVEPISRVARDVAGWLFQA